MHVVAIALQWLELVEIHLAVAERNPGTWRTVLWLPALTQGGSRAATGVEFLLALECHQRHQRHQSQVFGVLGVVGFRVFQRSQLFPGLVEQHAANLGGWPSITVEHLEPSVQELQENGQTHWLAGPLLIL